ncbi:hypothetical protein BH10PLA2_BH10PLA2_14610 [soil metagenome]
MMDKKTTDKVEAKNANRDPLTGEPGAHPVGAGVGAAAGGAAAGAALGAAGAAIAGGAAAGSALGAAAGPIGVVVGAIAGGVAGGLAGKGVAEQIDPTVEGAYWKEHHQSRPYYKPGMSYNDDYLPAYQYGWESRRTSSGRSYSEVEPELRKNWSTGKAKSKLEWEHASQAIRDAWERAGRTSTNQPLPK